MALPSHLNGDAETIVVAGLKFSASLLSGVQHHNFTARQ
jgi:hypothetical protein